MDDRYRVRPIRTADVDAALALVCAAGDYEGQPANVAGARKLLEMAADGTLAVTPMRYSVSGVVLVAEDTTCGVVVGAVTAGPPGAWARMAKDPWVPAQGRHDMATRLGEIYEVAVDPAHRRRGVGYELMQAVLNSAEAQRWKMALWLFHGDDPGATRFNESLAPTLPTGTDLLFLEPGGIPVAVRHLGAGMRVCLAPLDESISLIMDPPTGRRAVVGVFTGAPWQIPREALSMAGAPKGKAARKADKRARGQARR